jgi:hypothetical protein
MGTTEVPTMNFDSHALEQFVSRVDRRLSQTEALALLERSPRFKAEKTRTGEQYYDVPELGVRLITKRWQGGALHGQEVCITVIKLNLPPAWTDVELELLERPTLSIVPPPRAKACAPVTGWVTFEVRVRCELPFEQANDWSAKLERMLTVMVEPLGNRRLKGVKVPEFTATVVDDELAAALQPQTAKPPLKRVG